MITVQQPVTQYCGGDEGKIYTLKRNPDYAPLHKGYVYGKSDRRNVRLVSFKKVINYRANWTGMQTANKSTMPLITRRAAVPAYIASNISTRCFVLPWRICVSVLYLSRPDDTIFMYSWSLWVSAECTLDASNSALSDYKQQLDKTISSSSSFLSFLKGWVYGKFVEYFATQSCVTNYVGLNITKIYF